MKNMRLFLILISVNLFVACAQNSPSFSTNQAAKPETPEQSRQMKDLQEILLVVKKLAVVEKFEKLSSVEDLLGVKFEPDYFSRESRDMYWTYPWPAHILVRVGLDKPKIDGRIRRVELLTVGCAVPEKMALQAFFDAVGSPVERTFDTKDPRLGWVAVANLGSPMPSGWRWIFRPTDKRSISYDRRATYGDQRAHEGFCVTQFDFVFNQ